MLVKIYPEKVQAIAAICYAIEKNVSTKSAAAFARNVSYYVHQFGVNVIAEHLKQFKDYRDEAEEIVNKYYIP